MRVLPLLIAILTAFAAGCAGGGGRAAPVAAPDAAFDLPADVAAADPMTDPMTDPATDAGPDPARDPDPAPDPALPDPAPEAAPDPAPADGPDGEPPPTTDQDGDGLDDAHEADVARRYRPRLSLHPDEPCPRMAILYRVRPHPDGGGLLHVIWDVLWERDCGAGGHPGDNEVHAATIDPSVPPPAGILAVRAIAHQGTACDLATTCGQCGLTPCETVDADGVAWPAVFASKGKHASYLSVDKCEYACFFADICAATAPDPDPPLVNAGEPGAPLVTDLTAAGVITPEAGWTEPSLMHYDPWGGERFGEAGVVSEDLADPAFDTPAPGCCAPGCPGVGG